MDRLTTGRRHVRAGSVTVTELLTRQPSPRPCFSSPPDDDVTDTIPVVRVTHRRDPAQGPQLAKIATLGVAALALLGAVGVASTIAQRRATVHVAQERPAAPITGGQALLPDVLGRSAPSTAMSTPAPEAAAPPVEPVPAPPSSTTPVASHPDDTAPSGTGATAEADSDLELVREFYESLPDSPVAAFGMLAPDVLGTDLEDFLASWSRVYTIDSVEVEQRADDVLATVRLRLLDGAHLRIQQLLTVAESPRRIVGVRLLSAQRG